MPFGGSVTYGLASSDGNGYRKWLCEMLVSDGHAVQMVGSRRAGTMCNNDNEGWRGFRIDQLQSKAKKATPLFLPNVVTINAGSNDCIQDFEIHNIGKRISDLLDIIWMASPYSTIVMSTLLVNSDVNVESRILLANEQFREVLKRKEAQKKKIVLVDMHSPHGPNVDELVDGTHPNDIGYYKMAGIWRKGVQNAISSGFVEEPQLYR
ncbi:hypothetical protein QQS21_003581 [Conoideocrella luteorostrata]|uniref:SGNH hydrolase-type esterase domain-containing protein n=1 Tax=Conoideocrella luteorostrata TaxID=1105319 RepID=A0AAJ0FWA8_9HYPO|nr:hypothetical protein QQS21_003581 [Conoideocrella luteorostrata]